MDRPSYRSNRLQAEDFRRLGVRLQEWRPAIIRRAAARIARELAEKQLQSPSEQAERELSKVTISTYRILDPRRRDDTSERVSVGRILPLALHAASQTRFCNGLPEQQIASTLSTDTTEFMSIESLEGLIGDLDPADAVFGIATSEGSPSLPRVSTPIVVQQTIPSSTKSLALETAFDPGNHVATRLESDSLLKYHTSKQFYGWLRRELQRPALVASLLLLTVVATVWVSRFNRTEMRIASSGNGSPAATSNAISEDGIDAGLGNGENTQPAILLSLPASDGSGFADRDDASENSHLERDVNERTTTDVASNIAEQKPTRNVDADQAVAKAEKWLHLAAIRAREVIGLVDNAFASAKAKPTRGFRSDPFDPSQESMLQETQVEVDDGPPPVPSEQAIAEAYQRLRQSLPQIVDVVSPATAPTLIVRLSQAQSEAVPGSADFWVAGMVAAKLGWTVLDYDRVRDGLLTLADLHQVSIDSLLAESFLQRQAFLETSDTHRAVLRGGFAVAESLLRHQSLVQCEQVIELTKRSAEFIADEDAVAQLSDYQDALEQMVRLRLKANDIVRWADLNEVSASDAAIAGRYRCLYLRDWDGGLKWLASSKDPRLAVLAQSELQLRNGPANANGTSDAKGRSSIEVSWSELASRWLGVASRNTGRVAESIRLHALALNEKALQTARGTRKLMIRREIDLIRASLSGFAFDSTQNFVSASWTL